MLGGGSEKSQSFKEVCDAYLPIERLKEKLSNPPEPPQKSPSPSSTQSQNHAAEKDYSFTVQTFVPVMSSNGASAQPKPVSTSNGNGAQPKPASTSNGASAQSKPVAAQPTQQQKELDVFIQAYKIAVAKHGLADGWVHLSPLAEVLRQLRPNGHHYMYLGVRNGSILSYIKKIIADNPNIVELQGKSPHIVRIKNSAK